MKPQCIVLVVVLDALDAKEDEAAENGEAESDAVGVELAFLERDPGPDHGDAGDDQDDGVGEAERDVLDVVGPGAVLGAEADEEIGGEDRAEEHDLGGEEEPDAELAVIEAGIGTRGDGVGNFHGKY